MSSKNEILNNIKKANITPLPLPIMQDFGIKFDNKFEKFKQVIQSVGGDAFITTKHEMNELLKQSYPNANIIVSEFSEINSTIDANKLDEPHLLKNVDVAIVKGEFGVAENGAVWIKNPNNRHRALYFIAENLIIVVDKEKILNNMHEAYEEISFDEAGYGVFISGPSKTADIEQSLVIGAHGPKSGMVFFI